MSTLTGYATLLGTGFAPLSGIEQQAVRNALVAGPRSPSYSSIKPPTMQATRSCCTKRAMPLVLRAPSSEFAQQRHARPISAAPIGTYGGDNSTGGIDDDTILDRFDSDWLHGETSDDYVDGGLEGAQILAGGNEKMRRY